MPGRGTPVRVVPRLAGEQGAAYVPAVLPAVGHPPSSMRWLGWWRRATIVLTLLGVAVQAALAPGRWPVAEGIAWIVALAVLDAAETLLLRRYRPRAWMAPVHVAVNLAFLAKFIWLFRGGDHPGMVLLILHVGATSMILARRWALATAVAITGLYGWAVFEAPRLVPLSDPLPPEMLGRMVAQVLTFAVAAATVAWFVTEVQRTIGDRESRLQAALEEHSSSARLAALGVQAAGIAHELGTPLSSIDMLAAEAQAYPDDAAEALTTLRAQVLRCRDILNRVRDQSARTVGAEIEGVGLALRDWVGEWSSAGLGRGDIVVDIPFEVDMAGCKGAADDWRAVVWTGLDNALRAGAPVTVRARRNGAAVTVEIDDSGPGPSPEMEVRAGEAFFTSWPGGGGRGLGLYVARTFARRVGGDVVLRRREGGGGRLEIRLGTLGATPGAP